jgi:Holliday junction resolvase RusA-like endonuclease
MDLTKHIIRRYAERIEGIKDEAELNRYIALNSELIKDRISKIYEFSTWIYRGQIGTDKTTANFYVRDDIVLVGDSNETKLYTLYRIDFDFPPETNKLIVKDLMSAMKSLREDLDNVQKEVNTYVEERRFVIDDCDQQLRNLRDQMEILEQRKRTAKEEIECKQGDITMITKKIDNYANKLCNSLEFKKDINSNMIKAG